MSPQELAGSPQSISPRELDRHKLLLGEGKDETLIFNALLNHLGIQDVRVEDYGGKNKLPDYLATLKVRPGFASLRSLGVTRDADADASSAFTSVSSHLSNRGFVTPVSSGNVEAGQPNVGIMILPDGHNSGMLEDLCLAALQADSSFQCVDEYFECITRAKGSSPNQISKARIHAWLAAQDPPDLRLGEAAQKGFINWDSPAFDQLRNFLTAL